MNEIIGNFQQCLSAQADTGQAIAMRAYMKNHFDFLGIPAPKRRQACAQGVKDLKSANAHELLVVARGLWDCREREYQYLAVDILAKYVRRLRCEDIPVLLALAQQKSWWDTVDGLAGVIGDLLRMNLTEDSDVQECMDVALLHSDFWIRRIAILHQLGWRELTNVDRLFHYSLTLAEEKEFFIRKAIGWALRDYAWHDPRAIHRFLEKHPGKFSTLTQREASKNMAKLGY